MDIVIDELDPRLLGSTRSTQVSELRATCEKIRNDEKYHNRLLKIAVFKLPAEEGGAQKQKINMVNWYGPSPDIDGWVFSVAKAMDNSEEYLGVQYLPDLVVPGKFEEWEDDKREKAEHAKIRQAARDRAKQGVATDADIELLGADKVQALREQAIEDAKNAA